MDSLHFSLGIGYLFRRTILHSLILRLKLRILLTSRFELFPFQSLVDAFRSECERASFREDASEWILQTLRAVSFLKLRLLLSGTAQDDRAGECAHFLTVAEPVLVQLVTLF